MRVNTCKNLLFAALALVLAMAAFSPAAYARSRRHAPKTARLHASAEVKRTRKSKYDAPRKAHKDRSERRSGVFKRTKRHRAGRRASERLTGQREAVTMRGSKPDAETSQPEVHVTHNRKDHPGVPPVPETRKATSADFLDRSPAAPTSGDGALGSESGEEPGRSRSSAAKPVSVVTVMRKNAEMPPVPTAEQQAVAPLLEPTLFYKRGRLMMPAAMKGSHEILVHQNAMADMDGLARIQDDDDLLRMRANRQLVALPANAALHVDERLPLNRRYCTPWTEQFLVALARAHYTRFHTPLQVNSAVRTVEFQQRLKRTNGNAAPAGGETASPHLTGQAVDLAKHGLSLTEIAWLRGYLLPLVQEGKVDVEEEFQQACFHVSVYKSYVPQPAGKRVITQTQRAASALAVAMP